MKYIYTFFLVTGSSFYVSAQNNNNTHHLPSQLRRVMANAVIEFKSFIGEKVKAEGDNTIYTSILNLEGTTHNQVMSFSNGKSYSAKLGEGLDKSAATDMIESWKSKISNIVGQSFEIVDDSQSKENYQKIGYLLKWNKLNISVHAVRQADSNSYNAFLNIMNL